MTKSEIAISKFIFSSALILLVLVSGAGCKKSKDEPKPGPNEVFMQNTAFNPSSITVALNTTITWTNKDGTAHTVTSNDGTSFSSGNIGNGGTFTHKFTATGSFPYHCTIHSGMTGTVIVN